MKFIAEHDIIQYFLGLIAQVKLFHWATMSYAKHKALDDLHGSLSEKVDSFVECYIGRYKKQPLKSFAVQTRAVSDTSGLEKFLDATHEHLTSMHKAFDKEKATELCNILDEMLGEIDRTMYLCKLS
jgi:mevalonate kinase